MPARSHASRAAALALLGSFALTVAAYGSVSGDRAGRITVAGGGDAGTELSGAIAGSGASSQENAQLGWVAGFTEANPGVTVSYEPTGSSTGREQFLNGAVQFAGTDSPLKPEELEAAQERCGDGDALERPHVG